jgi:succinoglycan biosynthesis transport protein ExoP
MSSSIVSSTTQELTISGLLLVLKRRRIFIILTTLFFVSIAVLLCIFMPRRYKATGEIQVAKQSSDELGLDSMRSDGTSPSDALEDNIALQTQAEILQSSTLALRVIKNLGLENTWDFQPRFSPIGWVLSLISPEGPKDPVQANLEDAPMRRTRVLKVFASHLKVKPVPGTQLIEISYVSSNPKTAAAVINQMTKGLVDYTFQTRYNATTDASQWLAGQMDELKKQAKGLQAKVVQLQREAGVYSLGTSDATGKEMAYSATLDRLQQSTETLAQATSNGILKGSIYEMVKRGDPDVISQLAGTSLSGESQGNNNSFSLLQTLRGQEAAVETQLAADTSKYGSANPKLVDEKASLASATAAVQQEVKRIGKRAENDYLAAQMTENNLRADYQHQRAAADRLNDKAVEYSIAKQEAAESRQLYETLYQHLKEAGVIEGLRSSNITVVDPGRVPAKPSQPNVPIYLGLSLVGGLFFGGVGALFIESIDDRVQSIEMIEQSLNTPLMAIIASAGLSGWRRKSELSLLTPRNSLTDGASMVEPLEVEAAAPDASNTAFSESVRSLRTALLLSRSAARPKVILITSAAEGEGKTTISMHLAASLVRNQSKVMLVEADMRRPTMSHLLSVPHQKGLSNLLSGDDEKTEIRPFADLPDLTIIPAGPTPPFPAELLGSQRMKDLIATWSWQYDFVIIDSPSLLAVTDAAVLSKSADLTLLVARHAQSTRKSVERAWQRLRSDPETTVGVVLNAVSRGSAAYDEYFGYYGNSYYGERKERSINKRRVATGILSCIVALVFSAMASAQNSLLIASGDLLHIHVADTPEMEADARVTDRGTVPIVGIGDVALAGLTPSDAATAVQDKLIERHYLNHPQVSINVVEFATQQVSVIGEVKTSGAYEITTPRPILDVLALAGGLTPEANRHILIERKGDLQHPLDYYVSNNGAQAIERQVMVDPGDTIVVSRAGIVYILGDVNRPGGYVMSNNESQLTLLQGLALAGGVSRAAKQGHAHLIRQKPGGGYSDTELSVGELQKGKQPDLALLPGDVLYLPFSYARNLATTGSAGIAAATAGAAIYTLP